MTWLTVRECAQHIRRSPDEVRRWAERGLIPGYKMRRDWRFDQDEINAWVRGDTPKPRGRSLTTRPRRGANT